MSDWLVYLVVVLSGLVSGVVNTLAGGGSMITMPVLIALGIPANEANATNRLGFLFQSVVATWRLRRKAGFAWRQGLLPCIPLTLGAFAGAWIAVRTDALVITRWLGAVMLAVIPFLFVQPEKWLRPQSQPEAAVRHPWWMGAVYLAIGLYAGFLQVGMGYLLLASFILGAGCTLLTANALKVFVTAFTTVAGLLVFVMNGSRLAIHYDVGLAQAAGQAAGAFIGAHYAASWSPKAIRWFILVTVSVLAIRLLATPVGGG